MMLILVAYIGDRLAAINTLDLPVCKTVSACVIFHRPKLLQATNQLFASSWLTVIQVLCVGLYMYNIVQVVVRKWNMYAATNKG